jgi:uncharacterized OB-fold protein
MSGGIKLEYIRKQYDRTRTMPGKWDLAAYRYKFDISPMVPFLEMLKQRKLMGLKCRGCNTVYFPPKLICGKCLIMPDKWVPLQETGVVGSYTATYSKDPKTGKMVPLPVIAVRIDGSDTSHTIELEGVPFEETYVGLPVKIKWRATTTGTLNDIECCVPLDDPTRTMPLFEEEKAAIPQAKPAAKPAAAPVKPVEKAAKPVAIPAKGEVAAAAPQKPAKKAVKKVAKKVAKKAAKAAK